MPRGVTVHESRSARLAHAGAYTAGIVGSMLVLAGVVLGGVDQAGEVFLFVGVEPFGAGAGLEDGGGGSGRGQHAVHSLEGGGEESLGTDGVGSTLWGVKGLEVA